MGRGHQWVNLFHPVTQRPMLGFYLRQPLKGLCGYKWIWWGDVFVLVLGFLRQSFSEMAHLKVDKFLPHVSDPSLLTGVILKS